MLLVQPMALTPAEGGAQIEVHLVYGQECRIGRLKIKKFRKLEPLKSKLDFASRMNQTKLSLIVPKVLGKHIPICSSWVVAIHGKPATRVPVEEYSAWLRR